MRVEVAYAEPRRQWLVAVDLQPGATAGEAVTASGIGDQCPEIDPQASPLGIFGRPCGPETVLRSGDRVEIYRPLRVAPGQARRRRARKGR